MKTTREILEEIDRRELIVTASRRFSGLKAWLVRVNLPGEERWDYHFGATFDEALTNAFNHLPEVAS